MKYFAFLLLVCIAYTHAGTIRTSKDINDYAEFLKKSVNGKPQAPAIPELEELQPEWERSGKFEGDILLTENQIDELVDEYSGVRNAITNQNRLWPNRVVVYNINKSYFTSAQVKAIEDGIAEMARLSCLIFKERTPGDRDYINIEGKTGGCFATVGYNANGAQTLNLQPYTPGSGCFRHGTIVHEFLHGIGFYHMQSTHDRDDFVRIVWDKIQPGTEHNFNKYTSSQVTNLNTVYDYGSVMHYSEYGFSTDGSKTIVPLKTTSETIGQRVQMSQRDITKLNRLYNCPGF
ncbi:seminal metalloprotease 1-like [Arctopsyche grandis]|uniref:seminal metalloprotease 1-like n=1 Tax=Arctopsyche grandis TaxID=121162 RepID=UPI00406D7DD1